MFPSSPRPTAVTPFSPRMALRQTLLPQLNGCIPTYDGTAGMLTPSVLTQRRVSRERWCGPAAIVAARHVSTAAAPSSQIKLKGAFCISTNPSRSAAVK